jgi:hypothetical protein
MTLSNPPIGTTASPNRWQRAAPIVTLLLLSPLITNVLFGAIRITNIFAVVPAASSWGCGSLIIREMERRRRQGWPAILILGIALAVAEECVILQTSLFPLVGVDPDHVYGRALGVNWPYLLWALVYESVWAVAIPIQLVEWIYPQRREEPWLGNRGFAILLFIFVVAAVLRWYGWTQVFIPQFFPESAYQTPLISIAAALAAIGVLVAIAFRSQTSSRRVEIATEAPPRAWLVGIAALLFGLAWFGLLFLAYGAAPAVPVDIPLVLGLGLAGMTAWILNRWTNRPGWRDIHSLALVFGALLASMLAGFLVLRGGNAPLIDHVGKLFLNGIAVLGLILLGRKLGSSSGSSGPPGENRAGNDLVGKASPADS